ncbi:MAG: family NAD(P)-dependent oxidoreductase [Mucilaginibacter sp.]|nr:family NAD(P)-dependent oxidoreductase [Mucilaginibacter sp.]
MKISDKIILITGGSAGIGFQIARLLAERGNTIVITGRNEANLKKAIAELSNGNFEAADVTSSGDVDRLYQAISSKYGRLDVLINNAGKGYTYELASGQDAFEKASQEVLTNYLSVIRMVDKFVPLLSVPNESAIVNVSSVAAFVPGYNTPTYSASKAALHSYTQSLRYALRKKTGIKVWELMPPW